jgi:two-component sensor histidine kinase/predicted hydrocarbon binding protein
MKETSDLIRLKEENKRLEAENSALKEELHFQNVTETVHVPAHFKELFLAAEKKVRTYFSEVSNNSRNGEINISGERYLLIRSASLSHEFMKVFKEFYSNKSPEEAARIGNNFLFDIAHVLGKEDALAFHEKMNLVDPLEKLAAGPVHFAFTGWANVEISPESNPSLDEHFYLKFYHHNSFEAQAWMKAKIPSEIPVCTMNSGYSSGWCEESFGMPLTAVEIACEAHGAERCTFIMAPPDKIKDYLEKESDLTGKKEYDVPVFFERKYTEDKLRKSLSQKETLIQEVHHRVKNNLQVISSLLNLQKQKSTDPNLKDELDTSIGRVNTMAKVQDMIYSSNNVASIDIEHYFKELLSSLFDLYVLPESDMRFEVDIKVSETSVNPDIAIPLGLIVNEIACNSFKHALKAEGLFYLKLKQESNGEYILLAGDNGQGITAAQNTENLGMSLISILCEQLDAKLNIKNSTNGLEYQITFKTLA